MTTDVSVRDINDSNLARSDIGRWLRMQHPFGLPRAATADVHRLRVCVARSFFSLFLFFFLLYGIDASICNVFTRECAGEFYIYPEISTDIGRDRAVVFNSRSAEGFHHTGERRDFEIDCSPRNRGNASRVWFRKGSRLLRNCWFVFGRECAYLIMNRYLQIGLEGETRTGLARDWEINACRTGRREKSCNQSPESHF